MRICMNHLVTLLFLSIGVTNAFCQKSDTTYFENRKVRSIEVKQNETKVLTKFFSEDGENLLLKGTFKYSYFDSYMNLERIVEVEKCIITREYWINKQDTIFNRAKFADNMNEQVNTFYRYISRKLKYPNEAFDKKIEGDVMVSFIVDKTGEITQIKPLTEIGYGLETSAVELIMKYKKWGKIIVDNNPVNCYLRLPVRYKF